jgi:cell division protein FtsL
LQESNNKSSEKGKSLMTQSLIQAYHQAPWRNQMKWIATFLLGVIVVALVAGLYLSISAQSVTIGLQIQIANDDKIGKQQEIADLNNRLGDLTAGPTMLARAKELGYEPIDPSNIEYMLVPGYSGRQTASLAPQTAPEIEPKPELNAEYTRSLSEVLFQGLMKFNAMQARRIP